MRILVILFLTIVNWACSPTDKYEKMLEKELASKERYDSLFFTFQFGMPKKDFYVKCWELNKEGLLTQGPTNLSVEYKMDTLLSEPAYFRFYPQFCDDKICRMPVEITYEAYAPWNKHLSADSLLPRVKNLMEDWYGEGFIYVENREQTKKLWVKVDGNRRIRIFKRGLGVVVVDMTDMTHIEELNDDV